MGRGSFPCSTRLLMNLLPKGRWPRLPMWMPPFRLLAEPVRVGRGQLPELLDELTYSKVVHLEPVPG